MEKKNTILDKIIAIQSELIKVDKTQKATIPTKKGGSFSYTYENLNTIIDALHPLLKKHGLAITHTVTKQDDIFWVKTIVYDTVGELVAMCPILGAESLSSAGNAMQSLGSGITYARRYNLKSLFNLYSEDDDGQSMAPKPTKASQKQIDYIKKLLDNADESFDQEIFWEWVGSLELKDLTAEKASQAIERLLKRQKKS